MIRAADLPCDIEAGRRCIYRQVIGTSRSRGEDMDVEYFATWVDLGAAAAERRRHVATEAFCARQDLV